VSNRRRSLPYLLERHLTRAIQSECQARAEQRQLELIAIRREETTMKTRDEYGYQHLEGEQCTGQSGKYSQKDRQSSEQLHRDDDRRGHEREWKPELPHNVRGSSEAENEELLPSMHQEDESDNDPEWQHSPFDETIAGAFHVSTPLYDVPDPS